MSYGVDLAVLASCNHSIVDYGTFGMWAGLLAGGRIVLPQGKGWNDLKTDYVSDPILGYATMKSPDTMWWEKANMENVEYVDVSQLNITSLKE